MSVRLAVSFIENSRGNGLADMPRRWAITVQHITEIRIVQAAAGRLL
jgi:hypothetical protein